MSAGAQSSAPESPAPSFDQIRACIEKGLHQDSVRELRAIAMRLAAGSDRPVALYVLASVFGDIEQRWDSRPVPAAQTQAADDALIEPLTRVLASLELNRPSDVTDALQDFVRRFIRLQDTGALG